MRYFDSDIGAYADAEDDPVLEEVCAKDQAAPEESWLGGFIETLDDDPPLRVFAEALSAGCHPAEAARLAKIMRADAALLRLKRRLCAYGYFAHE